MVKTITPFQNKWDGLKAIAYPGGIQEQLGGRVQVCKGSGTITNISASSGTFRLYDSINSAMGTPLISVSTRAPISSPSNFAFSNGVHIVADGPNSNIAVTVNYAPAE